MLYDLEVAEMKMLRFLLGLTRMDRIRNENIGGDSSVWTVWRRIERGDIEMIWRCVKER